MPIKNIKDNMCKFTFKFNGNSFDCFQASNTTTFQLKELISHIISSDENSPFEVNHIILSVSSIKDHVIIEKSFNTKSVHHITIVVKKILIILCLLSRNKIVTPLQSYPIKV